MKKNQRNNDIFKLKEKKWNTENTITLKFEPLSKKVFSFVPGQYITLYFLEDKFGWQGKSYSITSLPSEKFLSITVKKIGSFSSAIHNLKEGDSVKILGPEGYFYPNDNMRKVVFIAGGVGIAPFYSMIENIFKMKVNMTDVTLFYGNRTKTDIIFLDELNNLFKNNERFKIIFCLSRDKKNYGKNYEVGRISVKVIKKHLKNYLENYYFICGSINFVNNLWQDLKDNGIKEENILTEAFY